MTDKKFPWEDYTIWEEEPNRRGPARHGWIMFWMLLTLAMIFGCLAALSGVFG